MCEREGDRETEREGERERERDRETDRQTETGRDKIPNFKFYGDIISKKKERRRTFMTLSINALSTNRIFAFQNYGSSH